LILVTGATGTVGREVVAQLFAHGQQVRAMTRNPSQAKIDSRAQVVQGDFNDPKSLEAALKGVDKVFSLAFGPQTGAHEKELARLAKKAGVRHIVKLSAMGGDGVTINAIRKWHNEGEQAIKESGIAWTVVRPGGFMSNALQWRATIRSQGKVFSNYGHGKIPSVHPRDIGAVAVHALTQTGHEGQAYSLTGPEALTIGEQVKILSDAIGKPIEYVPISDEQARKGMQQAGMPGFIIDALVPFAAYVRDGKGAEVLPTVQQVTGRPALTFAQWAQENAEAFR